MLTFRIINYIYGTVCIRISGAIPEKLINLCFSRQIYLWGIHQQQDALFAKLYLSDFFRIRPLVKLSQTNIKVVGYAGLPFTIKKIKRRKMLVGGALLFLIALNVLSSYVWFVDVTGLKTLNSERILTIVNERGLRPGVFKNTIDTKQMENAILYSVPEVAWVGISFTGTRAEIEVVEKTLPKTEDKTPAHIVALKDGVITEIITIAGQNVVKKDDTVRKGDLLIKGFANESAPDVSGQPTVITVPSQLIRAKGIVKARVWYESYGEASLVRELHHPTGRQEIGVEVLAGSHHLILKQAPAQPFPMFTTETMHKRLPWRNSGFVVESIITIYHEEESSWQEITLEEARDEAKTKALKAVESQIPETATILSRNIEVLKTPEPNLVRIKISIETVEEIGQSMNITQS